MNDVSGGSRSVPRWAADLVAALSRDRPAVVTRHDLVSYLGALGSSRDPERTAFELQRLGWFSTLRIKGVWAFVPAGEAGVTDPYINLRAWKAREPDAVFALAGEAAAWHLGYVPRAFEGRTALWLPPGRRAPHGIRSRVSLVRIDWDDTVLQELTPSTKLLRRKGLDLTGWAGGLPAMGPEALLVQLGARPGSFRVWADLVPQLDLLASDCEMAAVERLLVGQSASARQRAAYLLHRGGRTSEAAALLENLRGGSMPVVTFGGGRDASWSTQFRINDQLVAPLQKETGKA